MKTRRVSALLEDLSTVEPVIALRGPRAVGKSTILADFASSHGVSVIDLDDPAVRDAVVANAASALGGPAPVCADEYQHALELLDALKARLNREGSLPGTAVLTGSTRQDAEPRTAQALTGRLHSMHIWPMSQGEVVGAEEDLVTALRDDPDAAVAAHPTSATTRADYIEKVCAGGFPMALQRKTLQSRNRWFDDYVKQSVERDALELAHIQQRDLLRDLLGVLAGRTGQVLNLKAVSEEMGAPRTTINDHVRLLEDLFLVERVPAWAKTLKKRVTLAPKLHVIDSGVAARLMRVSPAKLASLDPTALTEFGGLLETFVVGELRKQVSWLDESITVGHWRTQEGDEVDYVIEFDDGRVLVFEVKSNERVAGKEFAGMRKMRDSLGDRFIAGVALSAGTRSFNYEDRLYVMPVDRLWRPVH